MRATVEPKDIHPEEVLPGELSEELPDDTSDKEAGSGIHTPTFTSKAPLASRQTAYNVVTGPVTDALYHVLGIRKRNGQDLDEIATQPSVYDTAQAEFYQPRADWEVSLFFNDEVCAQKTEHRAVRSGLQVDLEGRKQGYLESRPKSICLGPSHVFLSQSVLLS
jgi:hypothetical protein